MILFFKINIESVLSTFLLATLILKYVWKAQHIVWSHPLNKRIAAFLIFLQEVHESECLSDLTEDSPASEDPPPCASGEEPNFSGS